MFKVSVQSRQDQKPVNSCSTYQLDIRFNNGTSWVRTTFFPLLSGKSSHWTENSLLLSVVGFQKSSRRFYNLVGHRSTIDHTQPCHQLAALCYNQPHIPGDFLPSITRWERAQQTLTHTWNQFWPFAAQLHPRDEREQFLTWQTVPFTKALTSIGKITLFLLIACFFPLHF